MTRARQTMRSTKPICARHAQGFTNIGILALVAVIALTSTATLQVGPTLERRSAEEELLTIGTEFSNALIRYAKASLPDQPRNPRSLEDLVNDKRSAIARRHLRKFYADSLTGKQEWGTILAPDGGIVSIYSLSADTPIKQGNFEPALQHFSDKNSYRDWKFTAGESAFAVDYFANDRRIGIGAASKLTVRCNLA